MLLYVMILQVQKLTDNIQIILDSLRASSVVEVQVAFYEIAQSVFIVLYPQLNVLFLIGAAI